MKKNRQCVKIKQKDLEILKKNLEILGDENRLRILCLVKARGELCVCDIYKALALPQNLVSYHLGRLRKLGFLEARKAGASVYYRRSATLSRDFKKIIKIIV